MLSSTLIGALSAVHIWLAGLAPAPVAPVAAQVGPVQSAPQSAGTALARATDAAWAQLEEARRRREQARADKAALTNVYQQQLAELDRLKRQRASWRRDRLLRSQLSVSHATAQKLAELDRQLRALDQQVEARSQAVARSIDKELGSSPMTARRGELMRRRSVAQRSMRPDVKKIVVPDDSIDPLADPEELEYQASLLKQSEDELAAELARLDRLAGRYQRMALLRDKRSRAGELGALGPVDDGPRRSTGRSELRESTLAGGEAVGDSSQSNGGESPVPAPAPADPGSEGLDIPPAGGPLGNELENGRPGPMFDVILADVVDAGTINALRAAELSSDPAVKARAAARAREQVKARLERLKKRRALMQNRAQELRQE